LRTLATFGTIGRTMRKTTAVRYFGNQSRLAEACGVTRQAVSKWGRVLPADCAMAVEIRTRGELKVDWRLYPVTRLALKDREAEELEAEAA